jgi:hypothetical protein
MNNPDHISDSIETIFLVKNRKAQDWLVFLVGKTFSELLLTIIPVHSHTLNKDTLVTSDRILVRN